jgi:hypothetical protein
MHSQTIVSQIYRMGRVTNPETSKAPSLIEVKVLAISPYMNRSPEIYLMLRRYQGDIPSTNLTQPQA